MITTTQRFNTYQKERFPLITYSLLIGVLAFAAAAQTQNENYLHIGLTFLVALFMFMLLRIADEFKDYEDDCKYRSYRAVPRGLVSLKELGIIGAVLLVLQLIMITFISPSTLVALGLTLLYWGLMSKEFFVPTWLKAHPIVYLLSHMVMMPLIAWMLLSALGATDPLQHQSFLALSFFNGLVLEIGRKLRQKSEEEEGVETYTFLWGKRKALVVWIVTLLLSTLASLDILNYTCYSNAGFAIGLGLLMLGFFSANCFKNSDTLKGKTIEKISGVWLLVTYALVILAGVSSC
jgi:4-hydroxybenzoate polyprenyltransferase